MGSPILTPSGPKEKRIRAFIALKTPRVWQEPFRALQRELGRNLSAKHKGGIRWTDPEQIHLTLRFFGSVLPEELDQVVEALRRIGAQSAVLPLRYAGVGSFPSNRRPRVIWAGLAVADDSLERLHKKITEATRQLGKPPEDRPFTPHLTLGGFESRIRR